MWSEEAVGRIASSLGNPIEAGADPPAYPKLPPPLEVCVIIGKGFNCPNNVRIRVEGNEGNPKRDSVVSIDYPQRTPYCCQCAGFGHWPQQCRRTNSNPGKWNKIIMEASPARHQRERRNADEVAPAKH